MDVSTGRVVPCSARNFWIIAGLALIAFAGLGYIAWWGERAVPPEMKDPTLRFLAFYCPVILVVLGLAALAGLAWAHLGKQLVLASEGISYFHRGRRWSASWNELKLLRPQSEKGLLRATLVGGDRAVWIEKFFFSDFECLLDQIDWGISETRAGRIPVFRDVPEARQDQKLAPVTDEATQRSNLEKAMLAGVGAVFQRDHLKGTGYFTKALRLVSDEGNSPYDAALKLVRQVACEERGAATAVDIERNTSSLLIIIFSQCPGARRKSNSMRSAVLASTMWMYEFLRRHCDEKDMGHFLHEIYVRAEETYNAARAELKDEQQLKEAGILPLRA
ncbi:MAG: hypothetical protein HY319_15280 [Armatimonadetes bacterium]|nr:hypothetical protein [Armatimonadota bacterium]